MSGRDSSGDASVFRERANIPDVIYKYRQWSSPGEGAGPTRVPMEYHQAILRGPSIWLASAEEFNDPFDSRLRLRYDLMRPSRRLKRIERMLHEEFPTMNAEKRRALARKRNTELGKEGDDPHDHVLQITYDEVGIFSASCRRDSLLMWSHYADSHKGFCVGLSVTELERFVEELYDRYGLFSPITTASRITYRREYPVLDPETLDVEDKAVLPVLIKSIDWEYEEEVRVLGVNGSKRKVDLPPTVICEVILGCECSDEDREAILGVVEGGLPHASVIQASRKEDAFELVFEEIRSGTT